MSTTSEEKQRQLAPRQAAAVQPLLPQQAIFWAPWFEVPWRALFILFQIKDAGVRIESPELLKFHWHVPFCKLFCHSSLTDPESGPRFWLLHSGLQAPCLREVLTVQDIHKKACALSNSWWTRRTTWKKQQLLTSVLGDKRRSKISNILEFEETRKLENIKSCNNQ